MRTALSQGARLLEALSAGRAASVCHQPAPSAGRPACAYATEA
jgi:hypothetical protein